MNDTSPIEADVVPQGALESISRAEIDIGVQTANKFPKHSPDKLVRVKQDMMAIATLDIETAEGCFYTLPRGGKNIQGPSVRLAEIAVSCYGNLRAGARILHTVSTGDNPHVIVQGVVMDLEKNITVSIEKRRRITKKKNRDAVDEDDINLATNACTAIAFRDCVFKIIPMALIKPVFEQAKRVAIGDARTLADRRARCIETFAKMGVQKERILAKLEKPNVESIDLGDLETLIGLHSAIKDGETNIDEAFPDAVAQKVDTHKPTASGVQQSQQGKPATGTTTGTTVAKTPPKTAQDKPKEETAPVTPPAQETPPSTPSVAQTAPSEGQSDEATEAAMGLAPEQDTTSKDESGEKQEQGESEPDKTSPPATPMPTRGQYDTDQIYGVKVALWNAGATEAQFMAWAKGKGLAKPAQKEVRELASSKLTNVLGNWHNIVAEIQATEV